MSSFNLNPVEKTIHTPEPEQAEDGIHLINEGAYGCIYHPGIACDGKLENTEYITKIQRKTAITENEHAIAERVKEISDYRDFFAPITKQCPVKIARKYVDKIQQCAVFKNESEEEILRSDYISNKIRFLGDQNLKKYLANDTTDESVFCKKTINTTIHLLRGVKKLTQSRLVHLDIKYGNVMVYKEKPIFIDFGVSIDLDNIQSNAFYVYDTYMPWCFDIFVCCFIVQEKKQSVKVSDATIKQLVHEFQHGTKRKDGATSNDIFLFCPHALKTSFIHSLATYLEKFKGEPWSAVYDHLIEHTTHTWDVYGVATMYLNLLHQFSDQLVEDYTDYKEILEKVVYSTPDERPNVYDTLAAILEIQKQTNHRKK
jgi:serine/threonine protein kinase